MLSKQHNIITEHFLQTWKAPIEKEKIKSKNIIFITSTVYDNNALLVVFHTPLQTDVKTIFNDKTWNCYTVYRILNSSIKKQEFLVAYHTYSNSDTIIKYTIYRYRNKIFMVI